jgi:tRNA(fMet)-specific endonuclease VapC
MSQRVLLDSDILSDIIKGINPNVVAKARAYGQQFGLLDFTSSSVLEILHGLYHKGAPAKIQRAEALFAMNNEVVPDRDDYRLGAQIAGALASQGTPIGIIDPLIAACAIRRGFGVATANTDHFTYIQNAGYSLSLENWRNL